MLLSMSVEREIKERLATEWKCQEFIYLGNTLLIVELEMEEKIAELTDACDRFCRWAYRIMGAVVTAGIGRTSDSLFHIHLSYEGAREAVSYRVLYGTKRAISIGEIVPKEQNLTIQAEDCLLYTSMQKTSKQKSIIIRINCLMLRWHMNPESRRSKTEDMMHLCISSI